MIRPCKSWSYLAIRGRSFSSFRLGWPTPRFDLGDSQWMPFSKRTPAAPERPDKPVFRMTWEGSPDPSSPVFRIGRGVSPD
jgi:hypothetical protein